MNVFLIFPKKKAFHSYQAVLEALKIIDVGRLAFQISSFHWTGSPNIKFIGLFYDMSSDLKCACTGYFEQQWFIIYLYSTISMKFEVLMPYCFSCTVKVHINTLLNLQVMMHF